LNVKTTSTERALPSSEQFTYIIGNNGIGKSIALEKNAQNTSEHTNVVVISSGLSDRFKWGSKKKDRKGGGSYTYLGNRTVGNGVHMNTLAANAVLNYVICLEKQRDSVLKGLLQDIGFKSEVWIGPREVKKRKSDNNSQLARTFAKAPLDLDFVKRNRAILDHPLKPFELMLRKDDEILPFSLFSSGEQNMVSTGLKILSHCAPNTHFYIDEPEISLHLEWQLAWPKTMQQIVANVLDCKFTVATHSPVIIASALKLGSACYNMTGESKMQRIVEISSNVENLIFEEFHTVTPNNKAIYEKYATVLNMALDHANTEIHSMQEVKDALTLLEEHTLSAAAMAGERAELRKSVEDFKIAIDTILQRVTSHG
jgi:hypothetical protein